MTYFPDERNVKLQAATEKDADMEVKISSKELNLAAYMKANGANLVAVNGGQFVFDTHHPETEWRVKHSNSCCVKVDNELLSLKRMVATR